MKAKFENRDIRVNGKFIRNARVKICLICDGHLPVTKKAADGECVGHQGLRRHLEVR
jgi:hypothetical protein